MPKPRRARVYRGSARNLAQLARLLRAGELVAVPTETVYGLAANALDARACRKIFAAKGRPANDPLIVHLADAHDLPRIALPNAPALRLAKKFWPGPLTLVLPKTELIPDVVSAGLPSVAVRVPSHHLFHRLLKLAGIPLAAPSANRFGYISPTTAAHVRDGLGQKIAHILDGGPCTIGLESTIVDLRDAQRPRLLRAGAITHQQLEETLGMRVVRPRVAAHRDSRSTAQVAPGLLSRHYSPKTPLILHAHLGRAGADLDEAWLFLAKPILRTRALPKNIFWLDPHGDLRGVARRLFAALRKLDDGRFKKIHAEFVQGGGLADAINDRLRRAAAK
ncbi:MAG: L-threonylcarbamoyladenylate synthase [Opitutaceae bacterium]